MSVMTEEELDHQIELNELYSNKNDGAENLYEFTESELLGHDAVIRVKAIEEYKNKVWEDIETRYRNDIKILGYLSSENLLKDVHNSLCYFAEQMKECK